MFLLCYNILYASVAELADALDLGSSAFRRAGSIPVTRTNLINQAHVEWSRELFDYLVQLLNKRMPLDVLRFYVKFWGIQDFNIIDLDNI